MRWTEHAANRAVDQDGARPNDRRRRGDDDDQATEAERRNESLGRIRKDCYHLRTVAWRSRKRAKPAVARRCNERLVGAIAAAIWI